MCVCGGGDRTAPTPSHRAASVEEESPARQRGEMVQRQWGHPVEPRPTTRPPSSVELRYSLPTGTAAVAQGSASARAGCCGRGCYGYQRRFALLGWQHGCIKGSQTPKPVFPGREDAGAPHRVRVCVGLQDHLPGDTHPRTFRESEQGTSVCQATTMACTDSQIHAGLSLGCFFPRLLAFLWGFLAGHFVLQLFQGPPLVPYC